MSVKPHAETASRASRPSETDRLRDEITELEVRDAERLRQIEALESQLNDAIATTKRLEGRLRVADLNHARLLATTRSLSAVLGELHAYKRDRECRDAFEHRPEQATDGARLASAEA